MLITLMDGEDNIMININKSNAVVTYINSMKNEFEDTARIYADIDKLYDKKYTILDYEKIINEVIEYCESYCEYCNNKNTNSTDYSDKIVPITKVFYAQMFDNTDARKKVSNPYTRKYDSNNGCKCKYRHIISITDFSDIMEKYLECSKRLKETIDKLNESNDKNTLELAYMTNNQYRKLGKVFKDDILIYRWISSTGSTIFKVELDDKLLAAYVDRTTPVMHQL